MHPLVSIARRPSRALALLKRVLGTARGRPFAAVLLATLLALDAGSERSPERSFLPLPLAQALDFLATPLVSARTALFDGYQKALPRRPGSQPVTIVAIDEKSLAGIGQWPWPRDQMAALVDAINQHGPAAIGLDIYLPEPDQTSPDRVAGRLPPEQHDLALSLRALPSHETILARSLAAAPTVLGAAGFDFAALTTRKGLRSVPLAVTGRAPGPFVRHFPGVLASLPELQAAARGQALLSVDVQKGAVRRLPLLAAVGDQLIPGLALEMLRVAAGAAAIEVVAGEHGVATMRVAELSVPTQPNGEIWLRYAPLASGMHRYLSAQDVLRGTVDPTALSGKLVLIGLVGSGLNDLRTTALGEWVPGIEIQAQLIEALFDGDFLLRPLWLQWLELALLALVGGALIWLVPHSDSRLASRLKRRPRPFLLLLALADLAIIGLGYALFHGYGLLLDAATLALTLTLVMGVLMASALIEGLGEAQLKLARLIENGIALGQERNRDQLLRLTLAGAREIAHCASVALYLRTEDNFVRAAICTSNTAPPELDWQAIDAPERHGKAALVPYAIRTGETLLIDDLGRQSRFDPGGIDAVAAMKVVSSLNVPLNPGDGQAIGLLQLNNAVDAQTGAIIPFDRKIVGFIEALAAQAAVAIENRNLLDAQKALVEAMIRIIAGAIDAKSPYTGGHCERVPELAILLAEAACAVREGPLADFRFNTEDEWREFRIGAWLHDCGKVTTPEYVVDKATKLETLFNRIHEIRTRFEVLLRDAQIERLRAIHECGLAPAEAEARYAARKAELVDDFAFVAECNLGDESMAPERVERLHRIAARTWWRHFDDRLGLSHEEQQRHEQEAATPLPALEPLLADKPRHLFERLPSRAFDPKYGFRLEIPEHLYNQGELHNLGVERGTLTREERFKINEHIIQTIVMLDQMPLPKNLRRVPEYAGTHHETLAGTGYPRGLGENELSIPSRIMAIADIFEALSASDRPYKKAKTLSECIGIMSLFKRDKHIDPVLFDLFLSSGVYKTYATRYLRPEQIDEVDVGQYLG